MQDAGRLLFDQVSFVDEVSGGKPIVPEDKSRSLMIHCSRVPAKCTSSLHVANSHGERTKSLALRSMTALYIRRRKLLASKHAAGEDASIRKDVQEKKRERREG